MTRISQLKQKLTGEYMEYMNRVRVLTKDEILSQVDMIADMTEIFHYLTDEDMDFDNRDAIGLLHCDSPLEDIVEYWRYNHKDISEGMNESIAEVSENALSGVYDEDEYEEEL